MTTVGQEIIRVDIAKNDEVSALKAEFAKLYDKMIERVVSAQKVMEEGPKIMTEDTIKGHMETIRKSEELMRCMSEASKLLEMSCMFAVKGLTA